MVNWSQTRKKRVNYTISCKAKSGRSGFIAKGRSGFIVRVESGSPQ